MNRRMVMAAAALALLAGVSCSSKSEPSGQGTTAPPTASESATGTGSPAAGSNDVQATDSLKFDPETVTIKVGDTVTWENHGTVPHTVTFSDGSFNEMLNANATVNRTFSKAGTFDYVCTYHTANNMKGKVVVA